MRPTRTALAIVLALVATSARAEAPRPMTVEDLWAMQRVGSPAVSPDGAHAVFTVSAYSMEENEGNTDLWIVRTDGSAEPRRLTWNEGPDTSPAWSPDGKRIAFVSKRGEGPSQIHVLPVDGGEARAVTDLPVAPRDPRWLPDGRRIAFVATTWPDLDADFEKVKARVEEKKEEKFEVHVSENRLVRFWDRWMTDGSVPHLFVLDLEDGAIRDLTPGSSRLMGLRSDSADWDISPEGEEIAFSANATDPPYRTLNYDLFVVSTSGGEVRDLTADHPGDEFAPRYSPDGRFLLYGRRDRADYSPEFTKLALRDRQSGETRRLAPSWDTSPGSWEFSSDGASIVVTAEDSGRTNLYRLSLDDGAPHVIAEGGTIRGPDLGANDLVVFRRESITSPAELFAVPLGGWGERRLTDLNGDLLARLDLGEVESVTFEGAGGDAVQMFVVLPPGFDPEAEWPLLVLVHGGPHGSWGDDFHYRWNTALFAAPGYVAAAVNFHGSTGRGQAFAESIVGAHGDKPFVDVMKAVDHLVAKGWIDETRMAIAGGSYGGYLTAWTLGQTDRFATGIVHAGVYDLMAQFASDATWGRPTNYGATPWEDPGRIDLWSPSRFAAGFSTPTLVLHGSNDYRVPVTQGLNLHGVLTAKGIPSRLVVFPEENHWILHPQPARFWWNEVHGWLDRWIGDREP